MYGGSGGYVVNDKLIFETHLSVLDTSSSRESNKRIEAKMMSLLLGKPDTLSAICSSSTTTFTWVINNFTQLKIKSLYSDVFVAGDYQWKMHVYPEGIVSKYLSVYLVVVNPTRSLPINIDFSLKLVNQILNDDSFHKRAVHQFREGNTSHGFQHFMCLTKLKDPRKGYLVKDTVTIEVNMSVFHSSSHSASLASSSRLDDRSACDSKKEIGAKMVPLIPATGVADSASILEKSKNLSEKFSSLDLTQKWKASSSTISGSALQQQREAFKEYLALPSLEAINEANAFAEIERMALLLLQHSANSLERATLKQLVSLLAAVKEIVPDTKSRMETVRAQMVHLSRKKVDVRARLCQGQQRLSSLQAKFSKILQEENELLGVEKERLLLRKKMVVLELEKTNEQVSNDIEEWRDEVAAEDWIQARVKLAQANLNWQLVKQNLELCEKSA